MFVLANVLQPLINVFEAVLRFYHDTVGIGWGFSIIALTITVRAVLVPLAVKQAKSARQMQLHMPELRELQKRHKDDKQRLQEETMKFYRENKVNPLASCLPLVAQLPVFISLFYMLRKDLKKDICGPFRAGTDLINVVCDKVHPGSGQFLFIRDITDSESGAILVLLLVLYVGTQLTSSLLSMNAMGTVDKTQRTLFLVLPVIFVPFIINFPAGLILYWITTNLWTMVQQIVIRKTVAPPVKLDPSQQQGLGSMFGDLFKGPDRDEPAVATAGGGGARASKRAASTDATGRRATSSGSGGGSTATAERRASAPPPPPRKKKKRSGRRR